MDSPDFKSTMGLRKIKSLQKTRSSLNLVSLKYNNNFCNKIINRGQNLIINNINNYNNLINFGSNNSNTELVYDMSRIQSSSEETLKSIIDLLQELRAIQDDKNILVQNNTVLREQILNQLKNEILKVSHNLTKQQVRDLEVVSSNNFDSKELSDILNSLLKTSKKKANLTGTLAEKILYTHNIKNIYNHRNIANYQRIISKFSEPEYKNKFNLELEYKIPDKKIISTQEQELESQENKKVLKLDKKYNIKKSPEYTKENILNNKKILKYSKNKDNKNILDNKNYEYNINKLYSRVFEVKLLNKTRLFVENIVNKKVEKLFSDTELVNKIINKTQDSNINLINKIESKEYLENNKKHVKLLDKKYNYNITKNTESIIPVIKLHTRISELKLASKTKLFVKKIIDKKTKNLLLSETELVDKVVNKSQIKELHENINTYREEYSQEKSKYKREIRNINTQIKNILDTKVISNQVNNILKNNKINNINLESVIKKNITKFMFSRERNSGVNLISDNIIKNINNNKNNIKHKFINKKIINYTQDTETQKVHENVNIEHRKLDINKKLENFSNLYEQVVKTKKYNNYNITKNKDNIINNIIEYNTKNKIHRKINNLDVNFIKNLESYNINTEKINLFKNILTRDYNKIYDNILNLEKIKNIYNYKNKNIFDITKKIHPERFKILDVPGKTHIFRVNQVENINSDRVFRVQKPDVFYFDKSHMVHKKLPKITENNNTQENKNTNKLNYYKKQDDPKIIIEKQVKRDDPKIIDTKTIEKNILGKTLNKQEIVNLIESYMKDINIRTISEQVMNKIEYKIDLDRRRRGIF